jgi:phage tail-like protein
MANYIDPYVTYRYRVDFDNPQGGQKTKPIRTGFQSVSGLSVSVGTMNYREGDERLTIVRKIPGLTKVGNVTLKWGLVFEDNGDTNSFFDWMRGHVSISSNGPDGDFTLMDVKITLLNMRGTEDGGPTWVLERCFPLSFSVPEMKAESDGLAITSMELAVGSFNFNPPTAAYSVTGVSGGAIQ